MVIVSRDVTDPAVSPFIIADHVVANGDGSISFALDAAATSFAGQEPNQYGVRNDSTSRGPYQKFLRQGALVTTVTRPGDQMFTYTLAEGSNFPAYN